MPNEGGQGGNTKFIHMMKTRVQKWLPVITGLMFSMHALAYDFESGGIYYNYKEFSDSEVYVTHNGTPYSGNSYSGHVKIPKTVTYNSKMYRVTEIGQQAFKSCKKLISVEIPESVTKIGNGAFDYSGLSSVNIPNSVTIIENNAFSSTQLTSIRIPGNATQWERAFAGCSKLTTVIIESGIKKIEKGAFANCTGLTSVSIPNSVTVISESAFSSCTALTSIDIPNSVTEISSTAFSGCKSLIHRPYLVQRLHEVNLCIHSRWRNRDNRKRSLFRVCKIKLHHDPSKFGRRKSQRFFRLLESEIGYMECARLFVQ